ncbi:MAG: LysM peptidoglycan-binding domain-containing protein [Phycisphaerae bacterium]
MTRETRIGMLIGLLFIFAFGLVLSELYGPAQAPRTASVQDTEPDGFAPAPENIQPQHVRRIHRRQPQQRRVEAQPRQPQRQVPDEQPRQDQPRPSYFEYTIQTGDNLTTIARRFLRDDSRAAVARIYQANVDRLQSPDRLVVGTRIRIPRN